MIGIPFQLVVDGVAVSADQAIESLVRSAISSLFTWRRAEPDDKLPGGSKYGWWGDAYPNVPGDKWGSRLWLLSRSALTDETPLRAKQYAEEALQWIIDDGVATAVEIQAERVGLNQLSIGCLIVRGDQTRINIRFSNVWNYLAQ